MLRTVLTVMSVLTLVPLVAAQAADPPGVAITGVVQPLVGPTICQQGTHRLDCTNVLLQSSAVDLDQSVGKLVQLLGDDVGVECPVIDVALVDPDPPATLRSCGSPVPGCPFKLVICPGALSQFWLWAALAPGYAPLNPSKGTWLLGEPFFLIAAGSGGAICHELQFIVPGDPAIIGVPIWMQAARRDIGPAGPPALTNALCITIFPSLAPGCLPIDC